MIPRLELTPDPLAGAVLGEEEATGLDAATELDATGLAELTDAAAFDATAEVLALVDTAAEAGEDDAGAYDWSGAVLLAAAGAETGA